MTVRVHLRSVPGPYEQYGGTVTVNVASLDDAKAKAVAKLRAGAFPHRTGDMWKLERMEVLST